MNKIKLFFEYIYMCVYRVTWSSVSNSGQFISFMLFAFLVFFTMLLSLFKLRVSQVFLIYLAPPIFFIAIIYLLFTNKPEKIVEKYNGVRFKYWKSLLVYIAIAIFAVLPLLIFGLIKNFHRF
jgi:hypothetical protein